MTTILPPVGFYDPAQHPEADPVRAWQAHLDAGRIGKRPPVDPAIRANLLATDALFRSFGHPRRPVWERRA